MIRTRSRRGFAMALMLVVLMVLTVITVMLVGTAYRDQNSARQAAARSEARLLATSVLEDFFARLLESPTEVFDVVSNTSGSPRYNGVFAGYENAIRLTSSASNWAQLPTPSRDGSPAATSFSAPACPSDYSKDCFYVEMTVPPGVSTSYPGVLQLTVGLRTRCAGVESRCVNAVFQQRVRRVQFYDFAISQEYNTLAPDALFPAGSFENGSENAAEYASYVSRCAEVSALDRPTSGDISIATGTTDWKTGDFDTDGLDPLEFSTGCINIAYQSDGSGGDNLGSASVYSLDDYLTVCGQPGLSNVFLAGSGTNESPRKWAVQRCNGALPSVVAELGVPALVLPNETDVVGTVNGLPPSISKVNLSKSGAAPVEITLNGGSWSAVNASGPSSGSTANTVIVITGDSAQGTLDLMIKGSLSGNLSVVVAGSAAIVDDLVYASCGKQSNCSTSADSFNLTASERIEIWQACNHTDPNPTPEEEHSCTQQSDLPSGFSAAQPPDRYVHGILTSPDGYIGVPDWLTNSDSANSGSRTQAKLHFYGAMASKYQGVFGGYADGELLSGYYKVFRHDDRLTRFTQGDTTLDSNVRTNFRLPPYLVESVTPVWVRLDVSEVSYSG